MTSSARFVIMPPSWDLADTHLARSLARGAKGESPWVAIARIEDGELVFVPRNGLGAPDIQRLVAEAQGHLDQQKTSWTVSEMSSGFLGFFKKPILVGATGGLDMELMGAHRKSPEPRYGVSMRIAGAMVEDDYAPERVLSPIALAEAHRMLGTLSLIAVLPKRGMMFVGPGKPGEFPAMMRMNGIAESMYGDAGAAAVCSYGFFIDNGKLVGVNGKGYLSLFPQDVNPWGPDW